MATVIVLLIVIILVSVFSAQNAVPVTITFLFWKFEASLAIIVFLSVIAGMIAGAIIIFLLKIKKPIKEVKKDT